MRNGLPTLLLAALTAALLLAAGAAVLLPLVQTIMEGMTI